MILLSDAFMSLSHSGHI